MFSGAAGRVSVPGIIYGGYGIGNPSDEQLGVSLYGVGISPFVDYNIPELLET